MSRSSKKGPYVDPKLIKKIEALERTGQKRPVKTWSRSSSIAPEFVGHTLAIHNGKQFTPVFVTEQMVGHKLGEFSPTRKFVGHGGKLAKATGTDAESGGGSTSTESKPAATVPATAKPGK